MSFVVLAAIMAWWVSVLKAHRREEAALVRILKDGHAYVQIDTGMPHYVRSLFVDRNPLFRYETLQGDFLPFDRVRSIELALPVGVVADYSPLAGLPHISCLNLTFAARELRDDDLRHFAGLRRLEILKCEGSPLLTDRGMSHLAGLSRLRVLDIGDTKITSAGMQHLQGLAALEHLHLHRTQIDDVGLLRLHSPNMRVLVLSETQVGDVGLKHVASMRELEFLMLYGTNVTDAGLEHLRGLSKLQYVDLRATRVTPAGIERLRRVLPELQVR